MWSVCTITVNVLVEKQGVLTILAVATLIASLAALTVAKWFVQHFAACECGREQSWALTCKRRPAPIVIHVPESPPPTMKMSTPRPSPPLTYRRARRAGSKRLCAHVRHATRCYNPTLDGHCGFQAILKAAAIRPTLANVLWLRGEVSRRFYQARVQERDVAQCNLHDLLRSEGLTLAAYCSALSRDLWASQVELQLACEVLGVAVRFNAKSKLTLGHGCPEYEIYMSHSHYVLRKIHMSKKGGKRSGCPLTRAGMRPGDQQPEQWRFEGPTPTAQPLAHVPLHPAEEEAIHIRFAPNVRPVRSMELPRECYPLVGVLRTRLAIWLQVSVQSICISTDDEDDLDDLPDWVQPPTQCIVSLFVPAASFYRIAVILQQRNTHFVMHVTSRSTRQFVEDQIANVIGTLPQFITLTDQQGNPWTPPAALDDQVINVTTTGFRAGAGGGTVSPTDPFSEDDNEDHLIDCLEDQDEDLPPAEPQPGDPDYDSEPDRQFLFQQTQAAEDSRHRSPSRSTAQRRGRRAAREQEQYARQINQAIAEIPRGSRSRSRGRAPTRDWSVESSVRRGSASPTRHGWTSSASPHFLPAAQNEPICKPALEGEIPIGYIWADPASHVDRVIITMHRELKITVAVTHVPSHAQLWQEVTSLQLAPRRSYDMPYLKDLRISRWELYQHGRVIPVYYNGDIEETILVPSHLSMTKVQERLDAWRPWRLLYTLSAIDHITWIIRRAPLPPVAVECVEAICGSRNLPQSRLRVSTSMSSTSHPATGFRAGARSQRPNQSDPRVAMIGWAQDRISRELPHLNQRTVRTLLRAEARAVSAALQCKSTLQLREVMTAAYKRAGMISPGHEPGQEEPQSDGEAQQAQSSHQQTPTVPIQHSSASQREQDIPWLPAVQALTTACAEATGQANATAMTVLKTLHDHQQLFETSLKKIHGELEQIKTILAESNQRQQLNPSLVPTEAVSTPNYEHEPGARRHLVTPEPSEDQQLIEVPSSDEAPHGHLDLSNISDVAGPLTDQIAGRSLRAACQGVVEPQQGGSAMRPFRAN